MATAFEQARAQDQQAAEDSRRRASSVRAGRSVDRSTRANGRGAGGRGGGKMPTVRGGRGSRAPASASQFHFNRKYSNRAGANRAPSSALNKLLYDHGLDEQGADRVDFTYFAAPPDTPKDALDLRLLGAEAERTAGRQSNSRMMAHDTISLPDNLSKEGRDKLARAIANETSLLMNGVPVFIAVHAPDGGNGNWHMHLSHPLRHIQPVGDDGAFKMGDRIIFEQRPAVRKAAGLPATNHAELRNLRGVVAGCIANALTDNGAERNDAERWRYGHLKLTEQVEKAARRGDIQFVIDSAGRSATHKEGLDASAWRAIPMDGRREAAQAHNKAIKDVGVDNLVSPELLTQAAIQRVLSLAEKAHINNPEMLRRLMHDHNIKMSWSANKNGKVQGVSFTLADGPRLTGKAVGASLPTLKKRFNWSESPVYRRNLISSGKPLTDYKETLKTAEITPVDLTLGAFKSVTQHANKLEIQASSKAKRASPVATPVENARQGAGETKPEPVRQRPKRASSSTKAPTPMQLMAAPASPIPSTAQAVPATPHQENDMNLLRKMMTELSCIPDNDEDTTTGGKGIGGGGVKQAPKTPKPPVAIDPSTLTQAQKTLLADEWDRRQGDGFGGPLDDAQQRLQDLNTRLRLHQENQPPLSQQVELQEKKRLFRKPVTAWVDTPAMAKWWAFQDKLINARTIAESQIAGFISIAIHDPKIIGVLAELEENQRINDIKNAERHLENAGSEYQSLLKIALGNDPNRLHDSKRAWSRIKQLSEEFKEIKEMETQRRIERSATEAAAHSSSRGERRHEFEKDK